MFPSLATSNVAVRGVVVHCRTFAHHHAHPFPVHFSCRRLAADPAENEKTRVMHLPSPYSSSYSCCCFRGFCHTLCFSALLLLYLVSCFCPQQTATGHKYGLQVQATAVQQYRFCCKPRHLYFSRTAVLRMILLYYKYSYIHNTLIFTA